VACFFETVNQMSVFRDFIAWGLCPMPVIPKTKQPAVPWKEFQERYPTNDELDAWSSLNYGVGVVCGRISNIIVIDTDSEEAEEYVQSLNLPVTPTVRTAKGRHRYVLHPGFDVPNGVKIVEGLGVDVRGDGGFVVAPPSIHATGRQYEWEISPDDAPFAPATDSILSLLKRAPGRELQCHSRRADLTGLIPQNHLSGYLQSQLNEAMEELRRAEEGTRNVTLNRVAYHLARIVAPAGAEWDIFAAELLQQAKAISLSEAESERTLQSAWTAGSERPAEWVQAAIDWAYASNPDQFIHIEKKRRLSPNAFNRTFKAGLPSVKGSFASFLTDHGLIQKVYDLRLDPKRGSIYEDEGFLWLNTYVPPQIEAVAGDASLFVKFVEHLIPNVLEREHAVRWFAHAVRNPGEKIGHAMMLRTARQGVGKTTLTNILRALIGEANSRKANSDELRGQFQSFLGDNLLVIFEEINLAAGREVYNRIKDMISDDTVVINEKYVPAREARNLANFIFLTNLPNPLLIEPDDRRFFYIDSPAEPLDSEFYRTFNEWWPRSLGVIRHWLDTIDLSSFNPRARPPQTESHASLGERSRSILEQELLSLFEAREGPFSRDIFELDEVLWALPQFASRGRTQITRALHAIGARPLSQHRVESAWHYSYGQRHCVPKSDERRNLWVIDNALYWDLVGPAERAKEYASVRGLFSDPPFPQSDFWRLPLGVLVR
jgi:hypothetical protein